MHAATSKVENSAQGSSCKLKFVHDFTYNVFTYYDFTYKWFYLEHRFEICLFFEILRILDFFKVWMFE